MIYNFNTNFLIHCCFQGAKVKNKKITSSDYTGWEKYDADTEVLKLDLEEERRIQERKKNEKKKEEESLRLDDVIKQSGL